MEHQNLGEQLRQGGQGNLDLGREMGGNASRGGHRRQSFPTKMCSNSAMKPYIQILCSHCRGYRLEPWSGN